MNKAELNSPSEPIIPVANEDISFLVDEARKEAIDQGDKATFSNIQLHIFMNIFERNGHVLSGSDEMEDLERIDKKLYDALKETYDEDHIYKYLYPKN